MFKYGENDIGRAVFGTSEIGKAYLGNDLVFVKGIASAKNVTSLSVVFAPTVAILDSNTLDDLRQYLTVTATYSNSRTATVTGYTLSGTLNVGTSTITVIYFNATTTFTVTVLHNYSSALSVFVLHPASSTATYSDGAIRLKCNTTTDYNNWGVWTADTNSSTLWSTVTGKTVRVRVKTTAPSFDDYGSVGIGIYSPGATSLGSSYARRVGGGWGSKLDDGYIESTYVCDLANFTSGSYTPTSTSRFGLFAYSHSLTNTLVIEDVQIFEVTNV